MESNGLSTVGEDRSGAGKHQLFLALLALATLLVYANSVFNGFVWDDKAIIIDNPINRSLSNVFQVLFSPDVVYQGDPASYYRPLNRFTYLMDYHFFGLKPALYHLESIFIHFMNVVLLYKLCLFLFKKAEPAFVAALLFSLHPVNSEAVNFISGRNNLLSVFFVLLSLLVYLRGRERETKAYTYWAALFFFLGLLCKETAAMLLFVLCFFQFGAFDKSKAQFKGNLIALAPFAVAVVAYLAMRQKALSGILWSDQGALAIGPRILQNLYIVPKYLATLLYPAHLNAHYTVPQDYLSHGVALAAGWLALAALLAVLVKFRSPAALFGLFWLGVNFIPISNLVPIPSAPMAERYLYLPAIGCWIIAGQCYAVLATKLRQRAPLVAVLVLLAVVLGVLTYNRNMVWKSDASLFSSMIQAEPRSAYGYYGLGDDFKDRGDFGQAKRLWEKTLELEPHHSLALNQLGNIYLTQGMQGPAEHYYLLATEADPKNLEAHYNLAMVSESLGKPGQAISHYEQFLKNVTPEYSAVAPKVSARLAQLRGQLQPGFSQPPGRP
jgi:protein O-mannosyl-transferase